MLPLPSAPKCRAEFHPILKMGNYVVIRGIYRSSLPLTKDAHSRFPWISQADLHLTSFKSNASLWITFQKALLKLQEQWP